MTGQWRPSGAAAQTAAHTLMLDAEAVGVVHRLDAAGIESILLKGPVTARWLYGDGESRAYSDIDLLVRSDDLDRAMDVLEAAGYDDLFAGSVERGASPHARTLRLKEGAQRLTRGPMPTLVDLHTTFHGVRVPELAFWSAITAGSETIRLFGSDVRIPGEPARAALIALHAGAHGAALADLDRALEQVPDQRWIEAYEFGRRQEASDLFVAGLRLHPLGRELIDRCGFAAVPTVKTILTSGGRPPVADGLYRLLRCDSWGERLALLGRELVPSRSFMRLQSPLARRGRLGLAAAYAYRPLWLLAKLPAAVAALIAARREAAG